MVCYTLGRAAFNELLGPIEDVWRYETLRKVSASLYAALPASSCSKIFQAPSMYPSKPLPPRVPSPTQVPILSNLTEPQLLQLARCMSHRDFAGGQVVFRQGDPGDTFYVVEEGTFRCVWGVCAVLCWWESLVYRSGRCGTGAGPTFASTALHALPAPCSITNASGTELARCGKGQCFGELALLKNETRAAKVAAVGAGARVLACTRADFDQHLGTLAEIRNMWRFEALRKVGCASG